MIKTCPGWMMSPVIPLASRIAWAVVPKRVAIALSVSPCCTM